MSKKNNVVATVFVIIFPLLLYVTFSFLYFGLLLYPDFAHQFIDNPSSGDVFGTMWVLVWWPFALHHHLNLFFTHYTLLPYGYNFAQTQAMPLISFLVAPLIKEIGIIPAFNFLTIFSSALSAYTAFWLCRYLSRSLIAGLFGGFLFGFSSYEIAQTLLHLCLIMTFLIPLIAWVCILFFQEKIKSYWFVVLYSFLLAMEFYINQETGVIIILFSGFALIGAFFIFKERQLPILRLLKYWFLALLLTTLLISPLLYYFFATPRGDFIKSKVDGSIALMNFLIPAKTTWLGGNFLTLIHKNLPGDLWEMGGYLGIPLLVICFLYAIKTWKTPANKFLISFTLMSAFFALGPFLHLFSFQYHIPMPWIIFNYLPITNAILPDRLMVIVSLLVAIIGALWFSTTHLKPTIKYGLPILSLFFLFPNVIHQQKMWVQKEYLPRYFEKGDYKQDVSNGGTALVVSKMCNSLLWQVKSHLWFRTTLGCSDGNPPEVKPHSTIDRLSGYHLANITPVEFRHYLDSTHVQVIMVSPDLYDLWIPFLKRMGYTLHKHDGMYIVRVSTMRTVRDQASLSDLVKRRV